MREDALAEHTRIQDRHEQNELDEKAHVSFARRMSAVPADKQAGA
jgi:hypothetical protein